MEQLDITSLQVPIIYFIIHSNFYQFFSLFRFLARRRHQHTAVK